MRRRNIVYDIPYSKTCIIKQIGSQVPSHLGLPRRIKMFFRKTNQIILKFVALSWLVLNLEGPDMRFCFVYKLKSDLTLPKIGIHL